MLSVSSWNSMFPNEAGNNNPVLWGHSVFCSSEEVNILFALFIYGAVMGEGEGPYHHSSRQLWVCNCYSHYNRVLEADSNPCMWPSLCMTLRLFSLSEADKKCLVCVCGRGTGVGRGVMGPWGLVQPQTAVLVLWNSSSGSHENTAKVCFLHTERHSVIKDLLSATLISRVVSATNENTCTFEVFRTKIYIYITYNSCLLFFVLLNVLKIWSQI